MVQGGESWMVSTLPCTAKEEEEVVVVVEPQEV